ncbi:GIY-YIG nuclease family protein [Streptomyces goshikiensis]|uniref:GIY-YIG nuclease family protein n=1 Tax=Streptomyces goshikiensis TaxID=1942 RepID=UPI0036CA09D6
MSLVNYAEFKLSITKALGDQLAADLEKLTPVSLTSTNLAMLPSVAGVYQLYQEHEDGRKLVYIGKADGSLPQRLTKHLKKLRGRVGVDLEKVTFTALSVEEDFQAVLPEKLLIAKHQGIGEAPWNNNGFGINDPGVKRDTTVFGLDHFDQLYPANLDWVIEGLPVGECSLYDLVWAVKDGLPYVFRFARQQHEKTYAGITVSLGSSSATADELFRIISAALPDPWQITALPGYVVMYPTRAESESARKYYRQGEVIHPS